MSAKNKNVKLNQNDCKNTLSAQKKVKPPKNVMVNNITDYWPSLNDEQTESFVNIIEK
jgi:hypothetical protein